MFKFKLTKKTYTDPIAATFKPGIPFGRKFSKGDLCLLNDGFQASKVFLNSNVLREALLNSKELLEELLEISIKDKRKPVEVSNKDMEVVEADLSKEKVPESGKNLVLDTEDLIVDKAVVTEEVIIEGVNEIPEGAEVVDEVIIEPAPKTKKTNKK